MTEMMNNYQQQPLAMPTLQIDSLPSRNISSSLSFSVSPRSHNSQSIPSRSDSPPKQFVPFQQDRTSDRNKDINTILSKDEEDEDEENDVFEFLNWKQSHLQQVNWSRVPKLLDKQRAKYETDMFAALQPSDQADIIRLMSTPVVMDNGDELFYTFEEAALYCFNLPRGLKLPQPGALSQEHVLHSLPSSRNTSPRVSNASMTSNQPPYQPQQEFEAVLRPTIRHRRSNSDDISHSSLSTSSEPSGKVSPRSTNVRQGSNESVHSHHSHGSRPSPIQQQQALALAERSRSDSNSKHITALEQTQWTTEVLGQQGNTEVAASAYYYDASEMFFARLRTEQELLEGRTPPDGPRDASTAMGEEEVMRWTLLLSEQEDIYGKNMFDILEDYHDHRAVQLLVREKKLSFPDAVLNVFQSKFGESSTPSAVLSPARDGTASIHWNDESPGLTQGSSFHSTVSSQSSVASTTASSNNLNTYTNPSHNNSSNHFNLSPQSSMQEVTVLRSTSSTPSLSVDGNVLTTDPAAALLMQQQQQQLQQLQQQLQQTQAMLQQAQQQQQLQQLVQQHQQLQQQLQQQQALLASTATTVPHPTVMGSGFNPAMMNQNNLSMHAMTAAPLAAVPPQPPLHPMQVASNGMMGAGPPPSSTSMYVPQPMTMGAANVDISGNIMMPAVHVPPQTSMYQPHMHSQPPQPQPQLQYPQHSLQPRPILKHARSRSDAFLMMDNAQLQQFQLQQQQQQQQHQQVQLHPHYHAQFVPQVQVQGSQVVTHGTRPRHVRRHSDMHLMAAELALNNGHGARHSATSAMYPQLKRAVTHGGGNVSFAHDTR